MVSPAVALPPSPQTVRRPYRILESRRIRGEQGFGREFVLELMEDLSVSGERAIRREYMEDLKLDFMEMHGIADREAVHVDFLQFDIIGGKRIEGRARIFSAIPSATMDYDAATRRGKITVQFDNAARGVEWAREWARKNLENLVRDKNILLKTGEKPPEGHYTSLSETWNGNFLEIEFKTE